VRNVYRKHTVYGIFFILLALIISIISLIFGAHEVAGLLSIVAVIVLLLFEGIRLLTENSHNKRLHDRFDEMERLIKKFKE